MFSLVVTPVSLSRNPAALVRGMTLERWLRLGKGETQEDVSCETPRAMTAFKQALTKGAKSVPYRNHKLTMLMQAVLLTSGVEVGTDGASGTREICCGSLDIQKDYGGTKSGVQARNQRVFEGL